MKLYSSEISLALKIIRQEIKEFKLPIVTLVANKKHDPFEVLVSCLLSLRTKDETTAQAYKRLSSFAKTPQEIIATCTKRIEKAIYPVGFYRVKAKNLKKISQVLIENFQSKVPDDLEKLLTLPGVGRKTANLVLTLGFQKLGICVDVHVHRISNRLGYLRTKDPQESEFALREHLPKRHWIEYNDLLVTWGQNICKPVSPLCSQCAVSKFCRRTGVLHSR